MSIVSLSLWESYGRLPWDAITFCEGNKISTYSLYGGELFEYYETFDNEKYILSVIRMTFGYEVDLKLIGTDTTKIIVSQKYDHNMRIVSSNKILVEDLAVINTIRCTSDEEREESEKELFELALSGVVVPPEYIIENALADIYYMDSWTRFKGWFTCKFINPINKAER